MARSIWKEVRIGDLGEVITGRTPPTERPAYFGIDFPFITPSDMHQGKYARASERSLSHEGAALLSRIKLPPNSVCVSCIGWQMGEVIMTATPSFTNQQINTIVPEPKIDPSFLYYSLRTRKQELLALGATAGVRTPILNKSTFSDLKIKLPSLSVQRRIVGILSPYDDLIENNACRIRILEELIRGVYQEWFINLRLPGADRIQSIKDKSGRIPEGWLRRTLGDLAGEVREAADPQRVAPQTPYVGLEHIPRRSVGLREWGTASDVKSSKLAFRKGEILFGKIRPYFHKVVMADMDGICSSDTIVLRPKPGFTSLVLCCASSDAFVAHASATSQGTKMPRANWDVLRKYPLAVPESQTVLDQFENIVGDVCERISVAILAIRKLGQTRDLLLPQLTSGDLDVSDLDIPTEAIV